MTAVPVLALTDVIKDYVGDAGAFRALHGVSLTVSAGEFLSIMGPSGSGKSTLMNIIGCLDTATTGQYHFEGVDTATLSEVELAHLRNRGIGFVFQSFNLLPRLSALGNVALPLVYSSVARGEREARAQLMLDAVGLGDKPRSRPSQLSGGQQQRVAVARALVNNPNLLLADEPTGALDSKTGVEVLALFRDLNRQRHVTVILVTHDPEVARATDRVIRIQDGMIFYDGPPTEAALYGAAETPSALAGEGTNAQPSGVKGAPQTQTARDEHPLTPLAEASRPLPQEEKEGNSPC